LSVVLGFGLVTFAQDVPFHFSASVFHTPPTCPNPTDRQLVELVHAMLKSSLSSEPEGFGLETVVHVEPFHFWARVLKSLPDL
jgi:hypothetical protein